MRNLRLEQHVAAPIDRVYAAYVDPELMPRWMELRAIADLSGALDRAGTTFLQVVNGPWRFRTEVIRAEAPEVHEMAGRAPFGTNFTWLTRFEPDRDGTRVILESQSRAFGFLDPLAERLFGASAKDQARRHLATLAALVEAEGAW